MAKYIILNILFVFLFAHFCQAQNCGSEVAVAVNHLAPEAVLSPQMVEKLGIDNCFTATEIAPDGDIFARMHLRSYKKECFEAVPLHCLRYLRMLHHDGKGNILVGEMVCHKDVAPHLLHIFRELYIARYPIESMVLVDDYEADDERSMRANNTSCFNYRTVSGSSKLSKHCFGMAVDINPLYNPYVKRRANGTLHIQPATAGAYANRRVKNKYMVNSGDIIVRLFKQHGFRWGGDWRSLKDYQHFEK